VAEGVHRRKRAARNRHGSSVSVSLVKDPERRSTVHVDCSALRLPQGTRHVALLESLTGPRSEHEVGRGAVLRGKPVPADDERELSWDRHRPRGGVRLRRPPVAVPVHLPAELDLGVLESSIRTSAQVRPHSSEIRAAVSAATGSDRLLELLSGEDGSPLRLRDLGPLRSEHQRRGERPWPSRRRDANL
jgi:hypothetical protein